MDEEDEEEEEEAWGVDEDEGEVVEEDFFYKRIVVRGVGVQRPANRADRRASEAMTSAHRSPCTY